MSASSFINEHTAEYYLVPRICKALSNSRYQAVPFYYWKTREGANMSKLSDKGSMARLLAVYARRPKVNLPGQERIIVKLNHSLFLTSLVFKEYDIPVFAGVPLASTFMDLSLSISCSWFYLNSNQIPNDDLIFSISTEGQISKDKINPYVNIIDEGDMLEFIMDKSSSLNWVKWIEIINSVSWQVQDNYHSFNPIMQWLGVYKPFYIAIFKKYDS